MHQSFRQRHDDDALCGMHKAYKYIIVRIVRVISQKTGHVITGVEANLLYTPLAPWYRVEASSICELRA